MSTRGCTPPCFARRKFLLACGAGVPIIGAACIESEFDEFRNLEINYQGNPPQPPQEVNLAVDVKSCVQGQDFDDDEYACSVSKALVGIQVGDQVRIRRNAHEYALFTVEEKRNGDAVNVVRMGQAARERLGTSNTFAGSLVNPVPAKGLSDGQAENANEFVERLVDDGDNDGLVVIAPHGGMIERNSDRQAEVVAEALGCSSWICKGWKAGGGCYTRWHITTTKISPRSFPGLAQIQNRGFAYSVAFHGMSGDGVLIGGGAPMELKQLVKSALEDVLPQNVDVTITNGGYNSGTSPENVVNWLTADGGGGIQLEQGMDVRSAHWEKVAQAIINLYSDLV